jgi:hypothetical protein
MYRGTTLDDMPMPTPAKMRPTTILPTPFEVPLCHPVFQPSVCHYRELKDKRFTGTALDGTISTNKTPQHFSSNLPRGIPLYGTTQWISSHMHATFCKVKDT